MVFVSNEVGLGIVPETPLGRSFRDAMGRLNMRIAERADRVILMAAGLPLVLADAISLERQALKPLRRIADHVLDTSDLDLDATVAAIIGGAAEGRWTVHRPS